MVAWPPTLETYQRMTMCCRPLMTHFHCRQMAFALVVDNFSPSDKNLLCTCFARVCRLKDFVQLFQSPTLGLHEEEVDDQKLKAVPEDKEDVEPVPDILQSDRSSKGVYKGS